MMKPVLCAGLVCLDQVTVVTSFPREDTDMRSMDQYRVRGGNANNSATVLAHLGFPASYLGTLADTQDSDWLEGNMWEDGVSLEQCPR